MLQPIKLANQDYLRIEFPSHSLPISSKIAFASIVNPYNNKARECDSPTNGNSASDTPGLQVCLQDSPLSCNSFFPSYSSTDDCPVFTAVPSNESNPYKGAIVLSYGDIIPKMKITKEKLQYGCCYPHCSFMCDYPEEMKEHFKNHSGKNSYYCLHSGCTFVSSVLKDMVYHRGVHTGERPYICTHPGCCFAAPNQSQLRLHMISHSSERPYKCSFKNCSYCSRYKSALVNHERTHTGERPYKCKYCKSFSAKQKSGLQYHIKTVHKNKI